MNTIAKIFGIGIVLSVADMILVKAGKNDVAFWLGLAGLAIVMAMVVPQIGHFFDDVKSIFHMY